MHNGLPPRRRRRVVPTPIDMPPPAPQEDLSDIRYEPWSEYFDEKLIIPVCNSTFSLYVKGYVGPVVFMLHGGGHSAMTWARCTRHLATDEIRIYALDLRGHGETNSEDEDDMSIEILSNDVVQVISYVFDKEKNPPPIVLVGHSMGGGVAVHAAVLGQISNLQGLVVVDVVEGTALPSLSHMVSFVQRRPKGFPTVEKAIEWSLRTGAVKNRESAGVSIPAQLSRGKDGKYIWRTDLIKTQPYWKGWFEGMSSDFLSVPCMKMLLLAGRDRMDTPLTIAHMQGKFQMTILPEVGHIVQEDSPEETAKAIQGFVNRNVLRKI